MKAKKLFSAIALAMGFTVFAGCTDASATFTLGEYWKQNSLNNEEVYEILTYDVAFNAEDGLDDLGYTLDYKNGTYRTTLKSETKDGEVIYKYSTSFSIDVIYTCNGGTAEFTDSIETEVSFRNAQKKLQPISSTKTTLSHSPMLGDGQNSVEYCYSVFHQTATTTYADDGASGTCTVIDLTKQESDTGYKTTDSFEKNKKLTLFDNEQLLVALRAFSSSTLSAKAEVYQQVVGNTQKVKFTFADSDEEEGREFAFKFFEGDLSDLILDNVEEVKKKITYRTASIVLDETNPGATQTAWVATGDATANTYRNMMLRLETPLSYGLGTLVYTLDGVARIK